MTSSSAIELRVGVGVALLVAVGCAEQPIEETQALVLAESEACRIAAVRDMEVINHYRAILFEFTGFDPESEDPPCVDCLRTGRCPIVAQECGCTGSHPPVTGAINRRVTGLSFTDVEPDERYCIALFGLDDPTSTLGPEEPSRSCECVSPADAPVTACGISPFPGYIEENASAIFVTMECGRACDFLTP